MADTFWITRMRLAQRLIAAGYEPLRIAPNPFRPDLTTWEFEISHGAADIVANFYREIGAEIPGTLQKKLF